MEFIGDKCVANEHDALKYIKHSLMGSYAKNGFGLLVVCLKEDQKRIGLCGFLKRDYLEFPDLGFALLPEHEGHGYMHEASSAILQFGKSHLKFDTVLAIVTPSNIRSQRLLEKLGFFIIGSVQPQPKEPELLLFSNKKTTQREWF